MARLKIGDRTGAAILFTGFLLILFGSLLVFGMLFLGWNFNEVLTSIPIIVIASLLLGAFVGYTAG